MIDAPAGSYIGYRECHVRPDWLLIYRIDPGILVLVAARKQACRPVRRVMRQGGRHGIRSVVLPEPTHSPFRENLVNGPFRARAAGILAVSHMAG